MIYIKPFSPISETNRHRSPCSSRIAADLNYITNGERCQTKSAVAA